MRCSICREEVSPGPEACPGCGGELEITASELAGWAGNSAYRRVSAGAGWIVAFVLIVIVALAGGQVSLDTSKFASYAAPVERLFAEASADDSAAGVLTVEPITCEFRCRGDTDALYRLRRRYDPADIPAGSELESFAAEEAVTVCQAFGGVDDRELQACFN